MQDCLVDSHVHLYRQFSPSTFIDAAAANISRASGSLGLPADTPGLLLFTQTEGERSIPEALAGPETGWTATDTSERGAFRLSRDGRPDVLLVRGRQVVSAEGLEVLALGMDSAVPAGESTEATIESIAGAGGLPVLPWGVGKWSGRRAEVVKRIASETERFPALFLGDNAGRPGFLGRPEILAACEAKGRRLLPGTDPLPFASEAGKVGRLVFRGEFDPDHPFTSLKEWLLASNSPLETHGDLEGPTAFFRLQVAMQLRKRARKLGFA